jgi:hypothetical protein
LSQSKTSYSESLRTTLVSKGIWHRFIEFDEPVRTVEEAGRKVSAERIIKSIVLIGSDKKPILAILPAKNRVSYKKIKTLLKVKDVRLAQPDEVLEHSGYPVGGVPPFTRSAESYSTLPSSETREASLVEEIRTSSLSSRLRTYLSFSSRWWRTSAFSTRSA